MKTLTIEEQKYLHGYATALQDIMWSITGSNTNGKRYDPISFLEDSILSYAFDLKSGHRSHFLSEFESILEITELMRKEAKEFIQDNAHLPK